MNQINLLTNGLLIPINGIDRLEDLFTEAHEQLNTLEDLFVVAHEKLIQNYLIEKFPYGNWSDDDEQAAYDFTVDEAWDRARVVLSERAEKELVK